MARRPRTLVVLAEKNILQVGTEIEVVPAARPVATTDPATFRATILSTDGLQGSVRWELDAQAYSLSELTARLYEEHGVQRLAPYFFAHWQRVGQTRSLWDEAEEFRDAE